MIRVILPLTAFFVFACSSDPVEELIRRKPALDEEIARHLVLDSDAEFHEFASELGLARLKAAFSCLEVLDPETLESHLANETYYAPFLVRLATALSEFHESPGYVLSAETRSNPSAETWALALEITEGGKDLMYLPPTHALAERAHASAIELKRGGFPKFAAERIKLAARIYQAIGDQDGERSSRKLAIETALELGLPSQAVQYLGEQAVATRIAGDPDAAEAILHRGLEIAKRAKDAVQIVRIRCFLAVHYRQDGRVGLADYFLRLARSDARSFPGIYPEIRPARTQMDFYTALGLPDLALEVSHEITMMFHLLGDTHFPGRSWIHENWRLARGRALLAKGQFDEAEPIFEEFVFHDETQTQLHSISRLLEWLEGYLEYDRYAELLALTDRSFPEIHTLNQHLHCRRILRLRALALFELGDTEAAIVELERARDHDVGGLPESASDQILSAELGLLRAVRSDSPDLPLVVSDALREIPDWLASKNGSTLSLLDFQRLHAIRLRIHRLLGEQPELGLRFELAWRRLARAKIQYQEAAHAREAPTLAAAVRQWFDAVDPDAVAVERMPKGSTLVAYVVERNTTTRFTANSMGIERRVLQVTSEQLAESTRAAITTLSDQLDPSSNGNVLHDLYQLLLGDVPLASAESRLLVAPEGCLELLPFDALSTSASYTPLASTVCVSTLPFLRTDPKPRRASKAVVVANPAIPRELSRELSLTANLARASEEAATVARVFEATTILEGARATKRAVLESVEVSDIFYFAAHSAAVPDSPLRLVLPLAATPGARPVEGLLDAEEIRQIDLSKCQLVVLSACGTVSPYWEGQIRVPSLPDAFVYAGAHRVIQTYWPIEDAQAETFMQRFLAYLESGLEIERALWEAKREFIAAGGAQSHPKFWSAFSLIQTGLQPAGSASAVASSGLGEK